MVWYKHFVIVCLVLCLGNAIRAVPSPPPPGHPYWDELAERLRQSQEKDWEEAPHDQVEWETWLRTSPGMEHLVPYEHQNAYETITTLRDIEPEARHAAPILPSITTSATTSEKGAAAQLQPRPHVCPVPQCGLSFQRQDHLKNHFYTHSQVPSDNDILKKPWRCLICNVRFSRADNSYDHIRRIHNDIITQTGAKELVYYIKDDRI